MVGGRCGGRGELLSQRPAIVSVAGHLSLVGGHGGGGAQTGEDRKEGRRDDANVRPSRSLIYQENMAEFTRDWQVDTQLRDSGFATLMATD